MRGICFIREAQPQHNAAYVRNHSHYVLHTMYCVLRTHVHHYTTAACTVPHTSHTTGDMHLTRLVPWLGPRLHPSIQPLATAILASNSD